MKERPILFSGAMVRAILAGRKTQTRRVVKPQPKSTSTNPPLGAKPGEFYVVPDAFPTSATRGFVISHCESYGTHHCMGQKEFAEGFCPYGATGDRLWVRETFMPMPHLNAKAFYQADDRLVGGKWKPSIFMPRALSRITLEVVKVRVERLQSIREEDAKAEGVEASTQVEMKDGSPCYSLPYQILWNQINGVGAWESNPWVWVVEFK